MALPTLSSGTTGNFNAVVISGSPTDFTSTALTALDTYEADFGVRQIDGYMFPDPNLGVTDLTSADVSGTTATLTAAGLTAFPELAGPVTFANPGTFGYGATVNPGAAFTSLLNDSAGDTMAGVYQHPGTDPQAGVAELSLFFDYNSLQEQWLEMAPGLINWVTQGTHLGLYRNYVEMDIDDTFTPDDAWSIDHPHHRLLGRGLAADAARLTSTTRRSGRRRTTSGWTSCSTTAAASRPSPVT